MLSNPLRLNVYYLKIIRIVHPHFYPKIIRHALKNKQNNMYVDTYKVFTRNHDKNKDIKTDIYEK